ncbi:YqhR family membrane protein [Bacillus sp. CGMCC 1.16607]|uniref:YqhR family membrane protein n=1 Tax=Bacillus sp. CGMCC 1.16607 TaxID=3351842 RepID=UPI0036275BB9
MGNKDQKHEQEQREKTMSLMGLTIVTGLFGGIFWSSIAYLAYVFHFTDIRPNVILEPWTIGDWKGSWLGTVISIILIGIFSIGASLIYYFTLRKLTRLFVGIAYGIVLFLLVFFVLNPIFPGISPFSELDKNTIVTSICIYILFGAFVGYSISYEESEIRKMKEAKQKEIQTT